LKNITKAYNRRRIVATVHGRDGLSGASQGSSLWLRKLKRLELLQSPLEFPTAHAKLRRKQGGKSALREVDSEDRR
jgi:hypothetical protein